MIDTFFEKTLEEEFDKIPSFFRFRKAKRIVFVCVAAVLLLASIRFFQLMLDYNSFTTTAEEKATTMGVIFGSWGPFVITNTLLGILILWALVGTYYERRAFNKATTYDRLHKDWVAEQLQKDIRNARDGVFTAPLTRKAKVQPIITSGYCPKCGLPTDSGEVLCELCRTAQLPSSNNKAFLPV